ncbi:hypothetical protein ACQP2T_58025 [Nonomuraea sp. CA-143628]|uniref:hypothetical protein n=1 Tax=Nonomuraea sp. CA-143628 TaxID=3239997 RepID=UPI003D8BD901
MSAFARHPFSRFAGSTAATLLLSAAVIGLTSTQASAHSLSEVVRSSKGCGWSSGGYTTQSSRSAINRKGTKYGKVYLLWSSKYGENCVVTLKSSWHGRATFTQAVLYYRSSGSGAEGNADDNGRYRHFAAAVEHTSGQCVRFYGAISSGGHGGPLAQGSRNAWGNCHH